MKKIIAIIILLASALSVSAQVKVKGSVKDSKGDPIVGAMIILEGTENVGSMTDADGKYTITIPEGKNNKLNYSCISYKSQTVAVGTRGVIDIVLEDDNELLDEVVVVGYGAMRRSDLTGSVSSVRIDEENAMKSTTIDQMLEGRAAGVEVLSDSGNPDAGISVRVRGISTFSGNSDPLYVIDGVIMSGASGSGATVSSNLDLDSSRDLTTTNPLAGINTQDIASIEVLKDASATAIYGSQGANGVVLITTKQAIKDKPVVNFNAGVSLSQASSRIDLMSFDQYVDMLVDRQRNDLLNLIYEDPSTKTGLKVTPVDWQDYVTRLGVSQRYYLSISGKPGSFNYFFSVGYNRNEGVLRGTDSENFTARLNLAKSLNKKMKLTLKATFGYTNSNLINGSAGGSVSGNTAIMQSVQRSKPFIYANPNDEMSEEDVILADADEESRYNPKRNLEGRTNNSMRYRVNPSLTFNYKILSWLTFNSTFGADFHSNENRISRDDVLSGALGNIVGYGNAHSLRWNWDNYLAVWKKWNKHTLSATLGHSMSRNTSDNQAYSAKLLPQKHARGLDINEALAKNSYLSNFAESVNSLLSFYGRAIYNYNERYILTATLRFDGSSRFKGANKWGVFPSAAFAWRIVNEPWFDVPVISNAKIRLGWGQVGNQNIGNYLTERKFSTSSIASHFNDSGKETAITQSNIVNENLKWETTNQLNAGIDLSFFKGRLAITADVYDKMTRDLLQSKKVSYSTGYSSMSVNDGVINNRGVEVAIDAVPVKTSHFEWTIGGNLSLNRNKIVDIGSMGSGMPIRLSPDSEPVQCRYFTGNSIMSYMATEPVNIFIEGQPMGLFYGYKFDGIVQEGETVTGFSGSVRKPGETKFRDLNNDGVWNKDDKTILGNPNPKFTYGFRTSLSYRRFTLSATFSGAYGVDRANFNKVIGYYTLAGKNSLYCAVKNAWTPENKSNEWPALGTAFDTDAFSDRFIEDGSYLRISSITLSYDFKMPKSFKALHGLGLSLSVGNPVIWTKYSGYSPVVNAFGNNIKRMGVDMNTTPYPRTYNFDVKFTF